MMMHGINSLLWPYFGITLMDEFGKLCLGCEKIVCGETNKMYQFVVNFMKKNCPGLSFDDVKLVAANKCIDRVL